MGILGQQITEPLLLLNVVANFSPWFVLIKDEHSGVFVVSGK